MTACLASAKNSQRSTSTPPIAAAAANSAQAVAGQRAESGHPKVAIGFAAETQNVLENARAKLARKGLDLIVANDVSAADSGFAVDTNRVTIIDAAGRAQSLPLMSKAAVAETIIDRLAEILRRP